MTTSHLWHTVLVVRKELVLLVLLHFRRGKVVKSVRVGSPNQHDAAVVQETGDETNFPLGRDQRLAQILVKAVVDSFANTKGHM